jgi:hypothetical protein
MVKEIRVPSSSSSSSVISSQYSQPTIGAMRGTVQLTDGNGLNADTLLEVSVGSIVGVLALQNLLSTESVDESCASCEKEMGQSLF